MPIVTVSPCRSCHSWEGRKRDCVGTDINSFASEAAQKAAWDADVYFKSGWDSRRGSFEQATRTTTTDLLGAWKSKRAGTRARIQQIPPRRQRFFHKPVAFEKVECLSHLAVKRIKGLDVVDAATRVP